MKAVRFVAALLALSLYAMAQTTQQPPVSGPQPASHAMEMHDHDTHEMHDHNTHEDEYPAALSYADLKKTADELEHVRQITAKYRDVSVARADGYIELGAEIKGMGIHFVRDMEPKAFDLERPPMLVYEKNADGYNLAGVVYLMKASEGPDGQPANNPFPKPLAIWHHHAHVCQLSATDHVTKLSEEECKRRGGHFNDSWMIHAWIWKDSPVGVFSPKNPLVALNGAEVEIHTK